MKIHWDSHQWKCRPVLRFSAFVGQLVSPWSYQICLSAGMEVTRDHVCLQVHRGQLLCSTSWDTPLKDRGIWGQFYSAHFLVVVYSLCSFAHFWVVAYFLCFAQQPLLDLAVWCLNLRAVNIGHHSCSHLKQESLETAITYAKWTHLARQRQQPHIRRLTRRPVVRSSTRVIAAVAWAAGNHFPNQLCDEPLRQEGLAIPTTHTRLLMNSENILALLNMQNENIKSGVP